MIADMKVKANLIQVFASVLFLSVVVIDLGQDSSRTQAWRVGGGLFNASKQNWDWTQSVSMGLMISTRKAVSLCLNRGIYRLHEAFMLWENLMIYNWFILLSYKLSFIKVFKLFLFAKHQRMCLCRVGSFCWLKIEKPSIPVQYSSWW